MTVIRRKERKWAPVQDIGYMAPGASYHLFLGEIRNRVNG